MTDTNRLLLHPKTKKQLGYFLQRPISPLLILGERGGGKLKLAYSIAVSVLGTGSKTQLASYPYFFHGAKPEGKQDIPIDTIREIIRFMRLKTPGNSLIRRFVLIEDANYLNIEAQNAFLKLLEEPNDDTLIVLTAPNELSLLPTIVSRCQVIRAHPVSLKQAADFYGGRYGNRKTESAWRLSQGSPSLLEALLSEEESHPLKQAIDQAKTFLGQSKYERLMMLDKTARSKDELKLFLEAFAKILAALHRAAVAKNKLKQAQNLAADRKLTLGCIDALDKNANTRLLSLNFILNLKS
ncbi:hypothetical protein HY379_01545 [Candidatus Saccharibacteria bacterium]|nr:hypothetical protein [Candidatus Saccharibacteria bacterium]